MAFGPPNSANEWNSPSGGVRKSIGKRIGHRRLKRRENASFAEHPLVVAGDFYVEPVDLIPAGYTQCIVNPSPVNKIIRAAAKARKRALKEGIMATTHDTASHLLRHLEKQFIAETKEAERFEKEVQQQKRELKQQQDPLGFMIDDGIARLTHGDRTLKKQISHASDTLKDWIQNRERELLSWKSAMNKPASPESTLVLYTRDQLIWATKTEEAAFHRLILHALCRFHNVKSHSEFESESVVASGTKLTFVERFKKEQEEFELSLAMSTQLKLGKRDKNADLVNAVSQLSLQPSRDHLFGFTHFLFS
jgi:hypothetical protein